MLVYQRVSRIQDVPHLCRQGVALHRGCPREGLRRMTAMAPMGTDAMGRRCGFEMIFDNQCGDLSWYIIYHISKKNIENVDSMGIKIDIYID